MKLDIYELSDVYFILSGLLSKPESIANLRDDFISITQITKECNQELAVQVKLLSDNLQDEEYDDILRDFTRLFHGPFGTLAHPYGSVYLDEGLVMGNSTIEIVKIYNECGLEMDDDYKELPDHIATELEFLGYLSNLQLQMLGDKENKPEVIDAIVQIRSSFVKIFMQSWVPQFVQKINESAETDTYKMIAELLDYYINQYQLD